MWEIKVWVLLGALAVTTTVISFLAKAIASSIMKKMDEVVSKLDSLIQTATALQQEVNHLKDKGTTVDTRLNNHSDRIRALEIEIGKLKKDK